MGPLGRFIAGVAAVVGAAANPGPGSPPAAIGAPPVVAAALPPLPRLRPADPPAMATAAPPVAAPPLGAMATAAGQLVASPQVAMAAVPPGLAVAPPARPIVTGTGVATTAAQGPATAARRHDDVCLREVAAMSLTAVLLPPVNEGICGIATPLDVAVLGAGRRAVELSPSALVDCRLAGALAGWLDGAVQDAAALHLGQRVTGIRVAASYACRGRNNDPAAILSEHGRGTAIDIAAFRLANGAWVEVRPAAAAPAPEGAFLAAIRSAACGPFTTVLGPGVALHDDHLHLDLAVHGRNGDALHCP